YLSMFPALRAARSALRAEKEAEAPFRALLAAHLEKEGLDASDIDDLIRWWKTANKWHRALNGDAEHEARAARGILAEARRRAKTSVPEGTLARLLEKFPNALVVAARATDLVVVEPTPRGYGEKSVPQNLYVTLHSF